MCRGKCLAAYSGYPADGTEFVPLAAEKGRLAGAAACMGNFFAVYGPHLVGHDWSDRNRVAGKRRELDDEALPRGDVYDCADVARLEPVLGQVLGEHDSLKFWNGGENGASGRHDEPGQGRPG